MLRLYILRHAKTGMALPGQRDFDRQLTERGIDDTAIIGGWVAGLDLQPAHIFCSPAERTRATLSGIEPVFTNKPQVNFIDDLYYGSVSDYFNLIKRHAEAEPLMIIGHNPMCERLANTLISDGDPELLREIMVHFPTGCLCAIDIKADDWSDLTEGDGMLQAFVCPKKFRK